MPGFYITRGLGGSVSSLISQGFISDVRRIFVGAKRFTKKLVADIREDLNISVMLLSTNGKELLEPIFNKVTKAFTPSDVQINVSPKKLILRKSDHIKITTGKVTVRNKNNERN